MKKYTITSEEYELMCDKLRSLENENSKLKGYIEGLEKQLTIPAVVGRSEQLVICKKCGSSEMYQYTKTKDKCEDCGNIQDY